MKKYRLILLWGTAFVLAAQAKAAKTEKLTGCLDEEAGPQYVLRGDQELRLLAVLKPQGFPVQNFARYLGHKVTVTGSLSSENGTPLMAVRSIKNIADICRPESSTAPSPAAPASVAPSGEGGGPVLSRPKSASGCLDEEPGPQYVLRGERELRLLYRLEPDGFPVQNFARFLGHRVKLSGRTYTREGKDIMKVKSIKTLAGHCAPPPQR